MIPLGGLGLSLIRHASPPGASQLAERTKGSVGLSFLVQGSAGSAPTLVKPASCCCSSTGRWSSVWQFLPCPGLPGTSNEGVGVNVL